MSSIKITNVTNLAGNSGTAISGVSTSYGSYANMPYGTTAQRVSAVSGSLRFNTTLKALEFYNGTSWVTIDSNNVVYKSRSVFGGGFGPSAVSTIDYITTSSTGNATDFGVLTLSRSGLAACSSSTRGVFGGGDNSSPSSNNGTYNTLDYITIASTGNATDFGDLTVARENSAACSSSTRGVFGGGSPISSPSLQSAVNTIDYITIASTGNATDFGDLTQSRNSLAACSSSTRGVFGGGRAPAPNGTYNTLDYITIASTGNATDFGDLTVARDRFAACSSSTRGVFGGSLTIDYITIATTGNATDFGDLSDGRFDTAACSSSTRGVFGGGLDPSRTNLLDYITIATTGNATDFGDLTVARYDLAACSNAHGGLS